MIGRRSALYRIGAWVTGGIWSVADWACCISDSGRVTAAEIGADAEGKELGEQLLRELERLEKRVYSEEGIPMLLACDNLIRKENGTTAASAAPANAPLAAEFRRFCEALPQARANASADDVAKVVELLADQDFTSGGTRFSP